MKNFLILILLSVLYFFKAKIIYQCSRYEPMPGQCMNKWVDLYNNVMIDLWKCPTNRYCQIIERNDIEENSVGVCMYNYKKLYDGDKCSQDSECASLNCENNICKGFDEGEICTPNSFQCNDNLACKKSKEILPYGEEKDIYKCQKISQLYELCENDNECDIKLVCSDSYVYEVINYMNKNNIHDITKLNESINLEEYLSFKKNNKKICVNISSIDNGFPSSNPMPCKSGDSINIEIFPNYNESICTSKIDILKNCDKSNTCLISINLGLNNTINISQECMLSSRGNPFCPFDQKEEAWKEYLTKFENFENSLIEPSIFNSGPNYHIPVHKFTFNNFEVSQAFWKYRLWYRYIEADICTQDFFFLKNGSNKYKYFKTFAYIYLALLIL